MNLNGDYISDALAACVGGIGIAPGANINYDTGHAIFEATHGTAPKYAGQDKVNPGSVILSGVLMLEHMGWQEAADLIVKGIEGAISAKTVTYDFERLMEGATLLKCSEFGKAIVEHMGGTRLPTLTRIEWLCRSTGLVIRQPLHTVWWHGLSTSGDRSTAHAVGRRPLCTVLGGPRRAALSPRRRPLPSWPPPSGVFATGRNGRFFSGQAGEGRKVRPAKAGSVLCSN
jgi:hypothetical protein